MRLLRPVLILSVIALFASASIASAITINEVRIDQPSTDFDEYVEFIGNPDEPFTDMWLLTIGDGASTFGVSGGVDGILDLTAQSVNANGFFLVVEDIWSGTLGAATPDLVADLGFENGDNVTHLLVTNLNPAISTYSSDLDKDDDGVIDPTGDYDGDSIDDGPPFTAIVDCIGMVETVGTGELIYCATTVGPDGIYVPSHIYVCADTGVWAMGTYDPLTSVDTPGTANPDCATPVKPTTWGTIKSLY